MAKAEDIMLIVETEVWVKVNPEAAGNALDELTRLLSSEDEQVRLQAAVAILEHARGHGIIPPRELP